MFQRVELGGIDSGRYYLMHTPPAEVEVGGQHPLIVALHGGGSTPLDMARFCQLAQQAATYGFATVFPSGSGPSPEFLTWNAGVCCGHAARREVDDVGFLGRLLDQLQATHSLDASRIYVAGMSNGGMMAYRAAAQLPGRFAAVACVAGCLACELAPLAVGVPAIHFHGTADDFVPYGGGAGARSLRQVDFASVARTLQTWSEASGWEPHQGPTKRVTPVASGVAQLHNDAPLQAYRKVYAKRTVEGLAEDVVIEFRIEGGGHTWPGQAPPYCFMGASMLSLSANDKICRFFRRFRL